MTNTIKITLLTTALMTAGMIGSAGANTADLFAEDAAAKTTMSSDATEVAAANNEYFRCAKFSTAVLNACIATANRKKKSTKPCIRHYQANIVRCQAINR